MNCCSRIKNKIKNKTEPDISEYRFLKNYKKMECIICLQEYNDNETVSLIKCGHMYHTTCLYTWFLTKKVCPLCDDRIELKIS